MTRDVHQELIDKFKDEPFSIIDKQGTILNKTHLSSMGYATHVPYSVVGLDDLLTSINELAHKKEDFEKENKQLKQLIDYHLNVCKTEKKKITDTYDWGIPPRQGKTVSSELLLKYIGAIEVLEQIKKELRE